MDNLQPCPCCLSDVDVVRVSRANRIEHKYYFFIHCNHCGKGTSNAYPSKTIVTAIWNAMVVENHQACGD
jgi:hypothetical protein